MTFKDFKDNLVEHGYPKYKAQSIFSWIYQKSVFDFDNMTDLSKEMRAELKERYYTINLTEKDMIVAEDGESFKFLFETSDGHFIESVLIIGQDPEERLTVCVSSQVGCSLNCTFCATGKLGFERDLISSEIISQVLLIDRFAKQHFGLDSKERAVTNIVYMGMGEPLLNYDEVVKSVLTLNMSGAFNLGKRHITISTAGIVPRIPQLAHDLDQVRLAISLNSTNQDKRRVLMPITMKYSVSELIQAVRDYQEISNRRVTFEYVLIQGINDDEKDVLDMKRALYKIKYLLNLIPFNESNDSPFERPNKNSLKNFRGYLKKHGIVYVERFSKGQDIAAACGQLGLQHKNKSS